VKSQAATAKSATALPVETMIYSTPLTKAMETLATVSAAATIASLAASAALTTKLAVPTARVTTPFLMAIAAS